MMMMMMIMLVQQLICLYLHMHYFFCNLIHLYVLLCKAKNTRQYDEMSITCRQILDEFYRPFNLRQMIAMMMTSLTIFIMKIMILVMMMKMMNIMVAMMEINEDTNNYDDDSINNFNDANHTFYIIFYLQIIRVYWKRAVLVIIKLSCVVSTD